MADRKMIYLDDAINELRERIRANGYSNVALVSELNRSIGYLMRLPSAQPKIIRCKDCKYWMRAYLSISGKHGCNVMRDYTAPDDYCFKAERKA